MLCVAVARSSAIGVAVCYVLRVFMDDVMFSYTMGPTVRIKHGVICLEEVRQMAAPAERQTTTAFGLADQNAALG